MAQPNDPQLRGENLVIKAGSSTPTGYKLIDVQNSAGTSQWSMTTAGVVTQIGGSSAVTTAKQVNWANDIPVLTTTTPGTDKAPVAGTVFVSRVFIPTSTTLTGIALNNGTAVGADKWIVALYSNAGVVLANSALAGTTASGIATIQSIPFTATYAALGPEAYYLSLSCNGTTARFRSQAVGVGNTISQAGAFGTLDALSPLPSAFVADVGPIACTY